ncbi:hypothetical protein BH23PSE2_BH23PSE2_06190 [soil metagenome]
MAGNHDRALAAAGLALRLLPGDRFAVCSHAGLVMVAG